ncbi:MAG TPA: SDR family oxidoreductase [Candidatus Baltobacteraceae bacterium]|nr:SDR family oxidoreductase [Candidatus Baltobacteraceae bacterium]
MKAKGSVAIVTGSTGGIGVPTVRALMSAGVHLALAAPASEAHVLEQLVAEATARGVRAIAVPTDVRKREEIDGLVRATVDAFQTVDVLCNVAGIGSSPSLCDETDARIEDVVNINLLGSARTMHAVLPIMKAQRRGAIVNIGSIAGEAGVMGIYSGSKFGLRGLTDSVRREVRSYGIGVTLIEPGFVKTPLNVAMGEGLPSPDIVANAVVAAIERPRRRAIVPWSYTPAILIATVFPGFIDLVFGDARIQERLNRDARAERAAREAAT